MTKQCEICKGVYIFENECPTCKPMKERVKKAIRKVDDGSRVLMLLERELKI